MPMIGARFYAHIDNLHVRGDILENELAKVKIKESEGRYRMGDVFFCRNWIAVDYFD